MARSPVIATLFNCKFTISLFTVVMSVCTTSISSFMLRISVCAVVILVITFELSVSMIFSLFTIVPAKLKSPLRLLAKFSKTDRAAGAPAIKLLKSWDTLSSTYNLFTASAFVVGILGILILLLNTTSPLNVFVNEALNILFAFFLAVSLI